MRTSFDIYVLIIKLWNSIKHVRVIIDVIPIGWYTPGLILQQQQQRYVEKDYNNH